MESFPVPLSRFDVTMYSIIRCMYNPYTYIRPWRMVCNMLYDGIHDNIKYDVSQRFILQRFILQRFILQRFTLQRFILQRFILQRFTSQRFILQRFTTKISTERKVKT